MNAFSVVEQFEKKVAEFCGARHAIAVSSGTAAIGLCLQFRKTCFDWRHAPIIIPAHTFVSVPMTAIHCGYTVNFSDQEWKGSYHIEPLQVRDSALQFHKGMYLKCKLSTLECLSFQARKILNIGEGGMILTGDAIAADWLRAARYCGRKPPHYRVEDIDMLGWQMYMTPEKAARGLHLMEYIGDGEPDMQADYPDLRPVFERISQHERANQ